MPLNERLISKLDPLPGGATITIYLLLKPLVIIVYPLNCISKLPIDSIGYPDPTMVMILPPSGDPTSGVIDVTIKSIDSAVTPTILE